MAVGAVRASVTGAAENAGIASGAAISAVTAGPAVPTASVGAAGAAESPIAAGTAVATVCAVADHRCAVTTSPAGTSIAARNAVATGNTGKGAVVCSVRAA
jgi:hypothetical protein